MVVYRRRTRVAAPLSRVWEFHSTPEGLRALTPGFVGLRVDAVRGPDGDPDPEALVAGTDLHLSVRPFGVGPRRRVVSRIVAREEGDREAQFRDVMVEGPFERWEHTHRFVADGDGTVAEDRVEYELPFGPVGEALGPLARVGLEPAFRYRHRRLRELLESDG
jgi:ligand-binding SRPBCC domain-containing protein